MKSGSTTKERALWDGLSAVGPGARGFCFEAWQVQLFTYKHVIVLSAVLGYLGSGYCEARGSIGVFGFWNA
jgi:hypothetical protein